MKYSASTRLPIRRPCMSVKATTTVSTSPRSTSEASASWVSGAFRVRGSVSMPSLLAASANDEPLEKVARPGQVGGQLFGVALDRHDQAVVRLDALDRSVLTGRRLVQARSQLLDSLVVEAVDPDLVLARGLAELRRRLDLDRVSQVVAPVLADVVRFEVLHEGAAHRDVDHLLPAADAQHRQLALPSLLEHEQLGLVQLAVDGADLLVLLLPVQQRIDVPAAGKKQAVDLLRQARGAWQQLDRPRAGGLHGPTVGRVVVRPLARARRDRYARSVVAQAIPVSSCCRRPPARARSWRALLWCPGPWVP